MDETSQTGVKEARASELKAELVLANKILAYHGVVDAFGHVSVRAPDRADRFLLSRNLAPGSVTIDDIQTLDLDGEVEGDTRRSYLERYIHAEIYRARPDVVAVVHSHSPSIIPFGAVKGARLRPIWHMSAFLGERTPVFEIRDHGGDSTDMLISSPQLGRALATCLSCNAVTLMRGHGCTVVGRSVRQVVYRAVYTELNARLQLQAQQLGEPTFLNAGEAEAASASNDSQLDRAWNLWVNLVT